MKAHRPTRMIAALSGIGLALALTLTGCGSEDPEPTPATPGGTPSATQTTPAGTEPPPQDGQEPTVTPSETAGSGEISGVPVYYVGESGGSVRLYREWRTVEDLGDPVESAVMAMMSPPPLDPDYATPWMAPDGIEVDRDGTEITVDVPAEAFGGSVGSELSALALQQLVYTATAASTLDGPAASTVTILMDGAAADAWGHVRVGEPTSRAPQGEVLSHVWILAPQEGDELDAGPVRISGYGASFEANFIWRIDGPSGQLTGYTLSDNGAGFAEFRFTEELEPGTYTVTVENSSGLEDFSPHTDSKTFVVR